MSIGAIKNTIGHIKPLELTREQEVRAPEKPGKASFGNMLSDALKEVNELQVKADENVEAMMLNKGVTPHQAMLALEKADVAFQLMNTVRSKIIRAYEEILRTQI